MTWYHFDEHEEEDIETAEPYELVEPERTYVDDCGRCDGSGEIGQGRALQTCPVCRGSALSSQGEAKLRNRFQKPSGEVEAGAKLPAEPSIRVRENGDVAGVASGHPEDSSASPGHRALMPVTCTRGPKCGMGAVYCESVPCGRVTLGDIREEFERLKAEIAAERGAK